MLKNESESYRAQGAYIFRVGELVLVNGPQDTASGIVGWYAALITQVPLEPVSIDEIEKENVNKEYALNKSGFRVEALSDPNS